MREAEGRDEIIVCRCEDITMEEVETAVDAGMDDPEEIKRFLHIGMGPCQGRTCGRLVSQIIARIKKRPVSSVKRTEQRPPLVTVPIRDFLGDEDG
ncbi:MAG: (2Fe-2S)-binding protein [bacterium]